MAEKLTVEQLRAERCYIELTPKQKKLVETFIATGGDRIASVMAAYNTTEKNARVLAYEFLASPKVAACFAAYFQTDPCAVSKSRRQKSIKQLIRIVRYQLNHADSGGMAAQRLTSQLQSLLLREQPKVEDTDEDPEPQTTPASPKAAPAIVEESVSDGFQIGDVVTQKNVQYRITGLDAAGKITAVEELQ